MLKSYIMWPLTVAVMLVIVALCFRTLYLRESNFEVPENAAYVILYSTGEGSKEKTEVHYLDGNGQSITHNIVNNVTSNEALSWNETQKEYNLFSHDAIYFYVYGAQSTKMMNQEMMKEYKFASEDGNDTVYNSGYIKRINMYYKSIPHGLSYAEKEYRTFDLITLYNNNRITNIRISEGATVSVNQKTGFIYALERENKEMLACQVIQYDDAKKEFKTEVSMLDLSNFYDQHVQDDSVVTLEKAVIYDDILYQVIGVGEENTETYLAEILITDNGKELTYAGAVRMDLEPDESIPYDVPVICSGRKIFYYSLIKPNRIITFNIEQKTFDYCPLLLQDEKEYELDYTLRVIDKNLYALKIDTENNKYSIFIIDNKGKKKRLVYGKLPKSRIRSSYWISDFYVIQQESK